MKKRLLAMTLVSALCAGMLAGCGGGSSASTGSTGDSGSTASGDAYNVTVIVKHTDGHFNKVIAGLPDSSSDVERDLIVPLVFFHPRYLRQYPTSRR